VPEPRAEPALGGAAGAPGDSGSAEGGAGAGGTLPVALAAISVDGRCRERNPADIAIFGRARDHLVERFADPAEGQALLARATTDGAAEGGGSLLTEAGERPFRVSLWRQRGGERIRIVAAFAALPADAQAAAAPEAARALPPACLFAHELRSPVAAVIGLAERLRAGGTPEDGEALARLGSDIAAAGWRLRRLADDLDILGAMGRQRPPLRVAEVEPGRLIRRIRRLAGPGAAARGVALAEPELPARGEGPLVLCDEGALWSVVDNLLQRALAGAPPGGEVRLWMRRAEAHDDLEIGVAVSGEGRQPPPAGEDEEARLRVAREMAAALGGRLAVEGRPGTQARLVVPAARCLDPA
jgi:signal transduction histidine kinase